MGKRTYTYYDFLSMFLYDRIPTLSIHSMLRICENYRRWLPVVRASTVNVWGEENVIAETLPALLGFHDVIQKVLKNHVASTREQRKRLLRYVTKSYACCPEVVKNPAYARFKKGAAALRKSIEEADGDLRIRRQPVPSDCVEPYKP